jgi:6-phosphogluconolactonase (cycloisomerase 2 family)
LAIDQSARFMYAANASSGDVLAMAVSSFSGFVSPVAGPLPAGNTPAALAISLDTQRFGPSTAAYVYVVNAASNDISGYLMNGSNGTLSAISGSPFAAGIAPRSVVIDAAGRFLYAANSGSNSIGVYSIDTPAGSAVTSSGGKLTAIVGSPFPADGFPNAIALDPFGRFLFVTNGITNTVSAYTLNSSSGALTAVPGSTVPTGVSPVAVSAEASGRFLYIVNSGSNSVSGYAINVTSGALTPLNGSPFATGVLPTALAMAD